MGILVLLGVLCFIYSGSCKPNGAPMQSCFYMTPRHIHPHTYRKVFPTRANGLYNITTSSDVFRPDKPLRVTLWGPPFKGFQMVAAEEGAKDWPTGIFYMEDGSSKRKSCLGRGDTATHSNSSYKDSVSLLWYGPEDTATERIQFIATVVVNMTIYYVNIKSPFVSVDPAVVASRQGGDGGGGLGITADPWLTGQENINEPWLNTGGRGLGGSSLGTGTDSLWGGSSWNTGTRGNNWNWNPQSGTAGWNSGQGSGTSSQGLWQSSGGSKASGSNWNWGQTTTASSWGGSWGRTTTPAPQTTQAPVASETQQQYGTAAGTGTGSATGATDTKPLSIDWIKNIPTKTWYDILKRLGFGISNPVASNTSSTGSAGTTVTK